ncbi:hypothetical protein Vadar_000236 [Vaccinium darrowii]|uniref:Uncharacterized protein n=1 Tax=Vaccinium darrowii TaxID=229202 RepID=A0ACB7XVK9_9ERIC|nr:hypothetical protein Vadar_000236 [Vaccinium darrowii]
MHVAAVEEENGKGRRRMVEAAAPPPTKGNFAGKLEKSQIRKSDLMLVRYNVSSISSGIKEEDEDDEDMKKVMSSKNRIDDLPDYYKVSAICYVPTLNVDNQMWRRISQVTKWPSISPRKEYSLSHLHTIKPTKVGEYNIGASTFDHFEITRLWKGSWVNMLSKDAVSPYGIPLHRNGGLIFQQYKTCVASTIQDNLPSLNMYLSLETKYGEKLIVWSFKYKYFNCIYSTSHSLMLQTEGAKNKTIVNFLKHLGIGGKTNNPPQQLVVHRDKQMVVHSGPRKIEGKPSDNPPVGVVLISDTLLEIMNKNGVVVDLKELMENGDELYEAEFRRRCVGLENEEAF